MFWFAHADKLIKKVVLAAMLATAFGLALVHTAAAATLDFAAEPQGIYGVQFTLTADGITATVEGYGGLVNPQNTGVFDPTAPWEAGASILGVSTNPTWDGIGCGQTLIPECVSNSTEDILLIGFDQLVIVQEVWASFDSSDDVTVWGWSGSGWDAIGGESATSSGVQQVGHIDPGNLPYGLTEYIMLVAENSADTAFQLSRLVVVVPEPGTAALIGMGLIALALRRRP